MTGSKFWTSVAALAAASALTTNATDVISGSFSTTPSTGPKSTQVNFTCQGAPTCTGTYSATHQGESCTNSETFSGAIVLTGLNASQPTSSGNVTLSNVGSGSNGGPICTYGTTTNITGSYTATSDGIKGSISVNLMDHFDPTGPPIALQGTFGVGAPSNVRVSGNLLATSIGSDFFKIAFSCTGTPMCAGVYTSTERDLGCSNSFVYGDSFVLNGFDLSHAGSFQGTVTHYSNTSSSINSDGTCTYSIRNTNPQTDPFTATWDGTNGTVTVTATDHDSGLTFAIVGTFTAAGIAPPPSFPMTVTANVTPTNANVSAQIQPRPQDVGTTQSVFVFAYAPLSIVSGNGKRLPWSGEIPAHLQDGPDPCVLAQVNANGQLAGTTASTMQPFTTGVLTSQGAAVTILNNVPTPNVAGATMYVGYGTNSGTMLGNGNYQGAVNIPGAAQCTTNLATTAAPASPGALTGLWWNANESGWGIHFTQRGGNVFAAWYTYDSLGKPKWYVSTCTGFTGASGVCNGTLYEVTGPNYFGGSFNPALVNAASAGSLQINFANANAASMTYTAAGQTRTVSLTRQPLATGTTPPAVDNSDIWWNPNESGWGMAMAQQYGITFLAWYVYDANGKPTWLVATCTMSGTSCTGTLYRTTGPAFGPSFDPSRVAASPAGTITVNFTDANNAIIDYTVDGVSGRKTVTRQLF